MTASIATYVLAAIAALSAATILVTKEVFHAALALIVCLLSIAGIFVTFNAEFLAVVQIVVYAGGVLLLIVFGIMLTRTTNMPGSRTSQNEVISTIIGLSLLAIFVYALGESPVSSSPSLLTPEYIGLQIVTRYVVEFELAGMLLLVSLVAAIVAATNLRKSQP